MGVLGWNPLTVMREADLADLADAYEGYARCHGRTTPTPPAREFLAAMMHTYPDAKESRP